MGRKILTDKDREEKEKLKKKKERQNKRREKEERVIEITVRFLKSRLLKVMVLCGLIAIVTVTAKDKKDYTETLYNGWINWDELKVSAEDLSSDGIEKVDGTIGFDAYLEYRMKITKEWLTNQSGIMSYSMYENLMQGVDSKYFYDSVQADYNDLCQGIQDLIEQSQWIKTLYEAYETEIGIEDSRVDYCMIPETDEGICELKEFIQLFTQGELNQFLLEAHDDWEALSNYRKDRVVITDGYANLLYQEKMCTDVESLKDLDVRVLTVGKNLYDEGPEKIIKAMNERNIVHYNVTEKTNKEALEQLGLYHDIDFYDEAFAPYVQDTMSALFAEEMVASDSLEYLGQNLSTEEVLEKLQSGEIGSGVGEVEEVEITTDSNIIGASLDGYQSITFSLTGRDERDLYYIFFKIDGCEHDVSNMQTFEEMRSELEEQSKVVEAQKDITAIITAEIEDLDITTPEDIKTFFPDFGEMETVQEEVISNTPFERDEDGNVILETPVAEENLEEHDHEH